MTGTPPSVHAETLIASAQALGNEIVRLSEINRELLAALKDVMAWEYGDPARPGRNPQDDPREDARAAIAAAEGRDS